jgi:hypothetical protein
MTFEERQLAKLTIDAYADQEFKKRVGTPWQALFNPTTLAFSRSNNYNATPSAGSSLPQVSFGGGEPDQISVELFFDGTGVSESTLTVRGRIDRLLSFTEFQADTHQPYYLHLYWGEFNFRGVLTKADVKYTLFERNGEPVRATVTISLQEALAPQEVAAEERRQSPDLYQTWQVAEGDTLDGIAERIYGSAAFWRPIAEANRLRNPRWLAPGSILTLPPKGD